MIWDAAKFFAMFIVLVSIGVIYGVTYENWNFSRSLLFSTTALSTGGYVLFGTFFSFCWVRAHCPGPRRPAHARVRHGEYQAWIVSTKHVRHGWGVPSMCAMDGEYQACAPCEALRAYRMLIGACTPMP